LHGALDSRDQRRCGAELVHAQTQQKRDERGISCHLSADTHPEIIGVSRVGDHFEQTQYCRMCRLVKVRDLLVHPIDCKRILNQIVCSDTEKIDLGCQHAGADGCAWDFDHRANFESFGHIHFRAAQFLFALLEHGGCTA
jgi:hypothetical protein